ncbi:hypothetical protein Tco_0542860 [Tanacetum coccineum]
MTRHTHHLKLEVCVDLLHCEVIEVYVDLLHYEVIEVCVDLLHCEVIEVCVDLLHCKVIEVCVDLIHCEVIEVCVYLLYSEVIEVCVDLFHCEVITLRVECRDYKSSPMDWNTLQDLLGFFNLLRIRLGGKSIPTTECNGLLVHQVLDAAYALGNDTPYIMLESVDFS